MSTKLCTGVENTYHEPFRLTIIITSTSTSTTNTTTEIVVVAAVVVGFVSL